MEVVRLQEAGAATRPAVQPEPGVAPRNCKRMGEKPMKFRTGRHNQRVIYMQLGDEPESGSPMVAVAMTRGGARLIVDALNAWTGAEPEADLVDEFWCGKCNETYVTPCALHPAP